jgi:glutathione S-transferase
MLGVFAGSFLRRLLLKVNPIVFVACNPLASTDTNPEPNMITLYTFGPAFGLSDPSPLVVKAMVLLNMANLSFTTNTKGYGKAPKAKLPYIQDDAQLIADSTFIRWHIEAKYQHDFDRHLSAEQKSQAWMLERMLEDHLYFVISAERWLVEDNFQHGPARFFDAVPWPMRGLIRWMVRSKVRKALYLQGMSRHSRDERIQLAARDIDALASSLGNNQYLFGDHPCGADATAYAFVSGMLCPHFDTPLRAATEKHANLVSYASRMKTQFDSSGDK